MVKLLVNILTDIYWILIVLHDKLISMLISGGCLTEACKWPGKPLITLLDQPMGRYISPFEITRSYPTSVDEGTTVVSISCMIFSFILRVAPSILSETGYDG